MAGHPVVQVTFVDAESGQVMGRTELAAAQLPGTFEAATRLDLGGTPWDVVRAEPPTAAEFTARGQLVLTLGRVRETDPEDVAYSLPTLYDPLPPPAAGAGVQGCLVLHEDDWRQVELVSRQVLAEVEEDLGPVRAVLRDHARTVGDGVTVFDRMHLRRGPAVPHPGGLSLRRLLDVLPEPSATYAGVCFREAPEPVAGSFAADFGAFGVYGRADGDEVVELCLRGTVDGLGSVMREFDLVLVDWCAGRLL
ncbi:hypothetical protein SRB5_58880 [Streptomyces sp. RB5]|uniref:Uncharacterized protein n=1 Tax=Streptomyces smaragdinus TaxID=2585196 RepID=A0A7K0CQE3_9ACTN|nr:hypothetical protein [Streptomyces smaragdinus]MQY15700.1 hypothetical protein [Streptomyces smaragdinus]